MTPVPPSSFQLLKCTKCQALFDVTWDIPSVLWLLAQMDMGLLKVLSQASQIPTKMAKVWQDFCKRSG